MALLEREEELAAADGVIAAALSGSGRFMVVQGRAGIGKTSILAEGRSHAVASGLMVLHARGRDLETAFSFGVVRQLFETTVAEASQEEQSRLLTGAAAQAARLFRPTGSDDGLDGDAYTLLHGLFWLTVNLAEMRPLLLAIDDVQWGDLPSLRWLSYIAGRLEGLSVSVLATLRPPENENLLLSALLVDPAIEVVQPSALSASSVEALVRQQLGSAADDVFCLACHRATGGNPLLLHELLRTLATEGISPCAASVDTVEHVAPDAVTRSVQLRLARLPAEAAALARAVAILGERAERGPAASLARLERREVAPAAAALSRADLLHPDPPFTFVHPLVRNAVHESIPAVERELAHAKAAEQLRELGAPAEEVSAQLLRAPAGSVPGAAAILHESAQRAAAEAGLESAVSYLTRALDEPLADEQRSALLLELAESEARLGSPAVIAHLRKAAAFARDQQQQGEVALALGHALYWAGDEEEGVVVLEEALAQLDAVTDDLRRRLEAELMANALRLPSGYEDARRRLAKIEVHADEGPGARLLLTEQAYRYGTGGGDAAEAAARAESALSEMPIGELAWNYLAGIYSLLWTDQLQTALRFLDLALGEVRRRGAILQFSSLSMIRGLIQYAGGALLEAEADTRAGLEAVPHKSVWFLPHAHAWLAQILVERGSVDDAADLIEDVEAAPDPFSQSPLLCARAMVAAARGDHRAALAYALELGEALTAYGHTNPPASYPAWRSLAALAHHALADRDAALRLVEEEVELARAWGAPRTLGRALRIYGLIKGGETGIERIREAVTVLADAPAHLEHAYSLANLGAALRRANQRAEARGHLRHALDIAQRCGARLLTGQTHEELIAAGARPRRVAQTGTAALTPNQRRIATMAAEGMSNRDIAQSLFITPRTVEMHLSNAFRKLGLSSRTQLADVLAAEDLSAAPPG